MTLKLQWRNRNLYGMVAADLMCVTLAFCLANLVRMDLFVEGQNLFAGTENIGSTIALLIALKISLFFCFGLYEGMWRYANLRDMYKVGAAVGTAFWVVIGYLGFVHRFEGFSRSVVLLDALFTFLLVSGLRIGVREIVQHFKKEDSFIESTRTKIRDNKSAEQVIVAGAGQIAEGLLRVLIPHPAYKVVALLDDDPRKLRRKLHGIRIMGGLDGLEHVASKYEVNLVLLAINELEGSKIRRLVEFCEPRKITFKRIPGIDGVASGQFSLKELRDVNYEDLLGRPAVQLEEGVIAEHLAGNVILVTGAGGSIGSELVRQILHFKPSKLVLVDSGEENLFNIQHELQDKFRFEAVAPIVGLVQDAPLMKKIMGKHQPDLVFHAAAYKHVPLMEANPWQAIENNVIGSQTVMQCAHEAGVKRFVLVSTDKAVRPTNVMGATKRLSELIMHAVAKESRTAFMAVRFGNVLGSSGSVIPIFRRQIARGGPVTVTHLEVTRYFMTIPEAARLILQAMSQGRGGEVFVLHMGSPVKIREMARDLIRLSGKDPDREIKIEYTGLRPGEKLHEELIYEDENVMPTTHEKVMMIQPQNGIAPDRIYCALEELKASANAHDGSAIKQTLQELIPEYAQKNSPCSL